MTQHHHGKSEGLFGLSWQSPLDVSRTHNVLWNGTSRLIQVGLQLVFVPVYIYVLGPDAYGLVVLSATLMAVFGFLEIVISSTVTREFGLHNGNPGRAADLEKMIATLERFAVLIAVGIAILVPIVGYAIARHWATTPGYNASSLWVALVLMGGTLAGQFLTMLYAAGLSGLQRQKLLSIIRTFWTPAYYGIGALLLLAIERSAALLFAWQMVAFLGLTILLRWALMRAMPPVPANQGSNYDTLQELGRFGAGSLILALSAAAVSQIDKVLVAGASQPAQFAAYGLALSIVMQVMTLVSGPFGAAMYPHFAQMLVNKNDAELRVAYHRWTQVVVLVSILVAGALYWVGPLLIDLWLGTNSPLAPDIKRLLPLVLAGWLVNSVITAPVMLIMASGQLQLIYYVNFVAIALAVAILPTALAHWGFEAGALYWLAVNVAYCAITVSWMHRSVLKGEFIPWALRDVLLPLMAGLLVVYLSVQLLPSARSALQMISNGLIWTGACLALLLVLLPEGRRQLQASLRFLRG
jgi:O-antigen/teichoic acid export membrane protein